MWSTFDLIDRKLQERWRLRLVPGGRFESAEDTPGQQVRGQQYGCREGIRTLLTLQTQKVIVHFKSGFLPEKPIIPT